MNGDERRVRRDRDAFSISLPAPAYPPPPYRTAPDSRLLLVFFRAEREALREEIPEPLQVRPDNLALVWIGDLSQPPHTVNFYHEVAIGVQVEYRGTLGGYVPYIWTSNDVSTLLEREIYGWPSQLCEDDPLVTEGNQIMGVCRRSELLVKVSMNITSGAGRGEGGYLKIVSRSSPGRSGSS